MTMTMMTTTTMTTTGAMTGPRRPRSPSYGESGMTLIAVMGMMVIFAVALLAVAPTVQLEVQRRERAGIDPSRRRSSPSDRAIRHLSSRNEVAAVHR